jgi:hypothetical protein
LRLVIALISLRALARVIAPTKCWLECTGW